MSPTSASMKAQRRLATPVESLAQAVMASFPEVRLSDLVGQTAVDRQTGEHVFQFVFMVDNGEHMPSMTAAVTLRRPLNEECVATAEDENGKTFGPGSLADVVDAVSFEHGGSHPNLVWMG